MNKDISARDPAQPGRRAFCPFPKSFSAPSTLLDTFQLARASSSIAFLLFVTAACDFFTSSFTSYSFLCYIDRVVSAICRLAYSPRKRWYSGNKKRRRFHDNVFRILQKIDESYLNEKFRCTCVCLCLSISREKLISS